MVFLSPIVTPVALQIFGEMASDEYETILEGLAAYGSGSTPVSMVPIIFYNLAQHILAGSVQEFTGRSSRIENRACEVGSSLQ